MISESVSLNINVKTKARFLVKKPQEFLSTISPLSPPELKEIQEYLWDVIMEESESKKLGITRSDIISRFEPTTNYQYRAACKEPLGYCTLNMCIKIDGRCATNRLRGMIEVLRKILSDIHANEDLDRRLVEFEEKNRLKSTSNGLQFNESSVMDVTDDINITKPNYGLLLKQKVTNLREILFSVIEIEGAETVILLDHTGNIIEMVSNTRVNTTKVNRIITDILAYVRKLGDKHNNAHFKLLTNEFDDGLMVMRPMENNISLVVFTRYKDRPAAFIQTTARVCREITVTFNGALTAKK